MSLSIIRRLPPHLLERTALWFILGQISRHILHQKRAVNFSSSLLPSFLLPSFLLGPTHLMVLGPGSFPPALPRLPSTLTGPNTMHFQELLYRVMKMLTFMLAAFKNVCLKNTFRFLNLFSFYVNCEPRKLFGSVQFSVSNALCKIGTQYMILIVLKMLPIAYTHYNKSPFIQHRKELPDFTIIRFIKTWPTEADYLLPVRSLKMGEASKWLQ